MCILSSYLCLYFGMHISKFQDSIPTRRLNRKHSRLSQFNLLQKSNTYTGLHIVCILSLCADILSTLQNNNGSENKERITSIIITDITTLESCIQRLCYRNRLADKMLQTAPK